ncbi:MAG: hypothetical protein DRQ99_24825 [Candidatus Parabeggiatoa sp. nov. 3]|nr:MAG: hypothetical protein DRQ99_24825 [Gammaproteobacteria bacterium]
MTFFFGVNAPPKVGTKNDCKLKLERKARQNKFCTPRINKQNKFCTPRINKQNKFGTKSEFGYET